MTDPQPSADVEVTLAGRRFILARVIPNYWQAAAAQIRQLRPDPVAQIAPHVARMPRHCVADVIAGALQVARENALVKFSDMFAFEQTSEGVALTFQLRIAARHAEEFKNFHAIHQFILALPSSELLTLRTILADLGE